MSVRHINETECGSWPTPTASEVSKISATANYGQKGLNNHPRIRGYPTREKLQKDRKGLDGGTQIQPTYPTPRDYKGESGAGRQRRKGYPEDTLPNKLKCKAQLNPSWVEWLMGWPIGWTDLKPLVTAKSAYARLSRFGFSHKDWFDKFKQQLEDYGI